MEGTGPETGRQTPASGSGLEAQKLLQCETEADAEREEGRTEPRSAPGATRCGFGVEMLDFGFGCGTQRTDPGFGVEAPED